MADENLSFDVVIVGAGPAGLAAAIRLAQRARQAGNLAPSIAVLEKGERVGAHILSGAVLDARPLGELFPDFETMPGCPVRQRVTRNRMLLLTPQHAWDLPVLPEFSNAGHYVISLGRLTEWLAVQAEDLGVNILTESAVTDLIYVHDQVAGVWVGPKGLDQNSKPKASFQEAVEIRSRAVILAEGAYGYLAKKLDKRFSLTASAQIPQTYATAVKELWQIPPGRMAAGEVWTLLGWPLDSKQFGGGFVYALDANRVSIGLVVGLEGWNPVFDPQVALQQLKLHPKLRPILAGGKLECYGSKIIPEAGWFGLGKMAVGGCMVAGDSAGLVNVPQNKGIHYALKSGMLAAETVFEALQGSVTPTKSLAAEALQSYESRLRASYIGRELHRARHFRENFRRGLWAGIFLTGLQVLTGGWWFPRSPLPAPRFTLHASRSTPGALDKLTALYTSGTRHEENQPAHLLVSDPTLCVTRCVQEYGNPCLRFCPASVYEIVHTEPGKRKLQVNFSNCVHCKTCELLDPYGIIEWVPPEGGGGPGYGGM